MGRENKKKASWLVLEIKMNTILHYGFILLGGLGICVALYMITEKKRRALTRLAEKKKKRWIYDRANK